MEQRKGNSGGKIYRKEDRIMEQNKEMGIFPVHSQVRKIKQEANQTIDWSPEQPEMRPVLREITRQQLSRSPLGLSGRPISVGDS